MRIAIYTRAGNVSSSISLKHWEAAVERATGLLKPISVMILTSELDLAVAMPRLDVIISTRADIRHVLTGNECHLKMIFLAFSGVNHLEPFDWVPSGTPLVNNRGASGRAMGEFAIFAMLLLANKIVCRIVEPFDLRAQAVGFSVLSGLRLTIIGTGGVGTGVAEAARSFRMDVIGVNRSGAYKSAFKEVYSADRILDAVAGADFVIFACPATPATLNLLDSRLVARMKPGVGIINISRGVVVDEDVLCDAVEAGFVSGAVLDVVRDGGLEARVRRTAGILVTPHVSGDDEHNYISYTLDIFLSNLRDILEGRVPANRVDLDLGY